MNWLCWQQSKLFPLERFGFGQVTSYWLDQFHSDNLSLFSNSGEWSQSAILQQPPFAKAGIVDRTIVCDQERGGRGAAVFFAICNTSFGHRRNSMESALSAIVSFSYLLDSCAAWILDSTCQLYLSIGGLPFFQGQTMHGQVPLCRNQYPHW